jgi:ATP-dependent DNA helicase RecQ
VADFLVKNGIKAEHFHAGLKNDTKDERQKRWKNDETRVIVSTNAFGMGIDKPEVRTVVHMDLPDNLEAYFQEAGRAGRDEKKAWAVILFNESDVVKMRKRVADTFPDKEFVKRVYDALGNYYQIAEGHGLEMTFPFDLADFCSRFKFPFLTAWNALKIMEQAGYLDVSDEQENHSQVLFKTIKDELYQLRNDVRQEKLIHVLLRSYTGLFTDPAYISEEVIAKRLEWKKDEVYHELVRLAKEGVIRYIPRKQTPFITWVRERESVSRINLGKEAYDDRKTRYVMRAKSMLDYAQEEHICRSQVLLTYFGEKSTRPCGECDICLKNQENMLTEEAFEKIRQQIIHLLETEKLTVDQVLKKISVKENKLMQVIRFMLDNRQLIQGEDMRLKLKR